ncbi:Peptidyl-prolyl isomerase [Podosphaera aphanis]|nr:Peptidyl-prolyl isomerase [Podosphaera aphanis]
MSSLYNLEPQPTASCIIHTSAGDISLELWASQLPLTCRNFLQHSLDGYYDNTIFHRLVPNFILQGGDPTGTGNGGESIYDGGAFSESREEGGIWPMENRQGKNAGPNGVGFKDEFHSRIKFNRRGLLGMANEGPDSNGSQFFFTLDSTPELQGKNTLFGRVEGETIYNVVRMGEAEVGEGERPLYPVRITNIEILVNPFKDMVRRERVASVSVQLKPTEKKKKRKAGKQLLSFEDDIDTVELLPTVKKAKYDTRIATDMEIQPEQETKRNRAEEEARIRTEEKTKKFLKVPSTEKSPETPLPNKSLDLTVNVEIRDSHSPEPVQKVTSLLERTNAQIAELKASMKRNHQTIPTQEKKKSVLELMIPNTSTRGRKRNPEGGAPPDQKALDLLKAFQSKLNHAPPSIELTKSKSKSMSTNSETETNLVTVEPAAQPENEEESILCDLHFIVNCQSCSKWDSLPLEGINKEGEDDFNDSSWMSHALSFKEDKLGKDLSYRKKAEEELVVIDPREKARSLKQEVKTRREVKSGNAESEWNKGRNDRFSRSARAGGSGLK